jgi:hypothetical protein
MATHTSSPAAKMTAAYTSTALGTIARFTKGLSLKILSSSGAAMRMYAYAENAPTIYGDPSGLMVWVCTRQVEGFPFYR